MRNVLESTTWLCQVRWICRPAQSMVTEPKQISFIKPVFLLATRIIVDRSVTNRRAVVGLIVHLASTHHDCPHFSSSRCLQVCRAEFVVATLYLRRRQRMYVVLQLSCRVASGYSIPRAIVLGFASDGCRVNSESESKSRQPHLMNMERRSSDNVDRFTKRHWFQLQHAL